MREVSHKSQASIPLQCGKGPVTDTEDAVCHLTSPIRHLPLQALAEKVYGDVIVPLIRAGDRAAVHQSQDAGASAALQRHDSAAASEGGLEAALLTTARFLSGMATSPVL